VDVGLLVEAMLAVAPLANDQAVRSQLETACLALLSRLRGHESTSLRGVDRGLRKLFEQAPFLSRHLRRFYVDAGNAAVAVTADLTIPARRLDGFGWLDAAQVAAGAADYAALGEFCARAARRGGIDVKRQASALLLDNGLLDEAVDVWTVAAGDTPGLRLRLGALRTLHAGKRQRWCSTRGSRCSRRRFPSPRVASTTATA
jgi:hypothetical protein